MRMRFAHLAVVACLFIGSVAAQGAVITVGVNFGGHKGFNLIPSPPAVPSARELAADAIERTVDAARTQLSRIHAVLVRRLDTMSDLIRARQNLARATAAYEGMRDDVVEKFRATASAQRALITDLEIQLDAAKEDARAQGQVGDEKAAALAGRLLVARTAATRAERQILQSDRTVQRYRYAQIDAAARLAEIQSSLAGVIRGDASWQGAKRNLDQARVRMASLTD